MATLLSRSWTGANGDAWDTVGFVRALGAAFNATIFGNVGRCGSTATARVYLVEGYPQTPGHLLSVDLDWSNAAGSSRAPGLCVRWAADGTEGYVADIDSNTGTTRVRLRRRKASAYTDIVAWTDISATVTSTMLNAGITASLRVEDVDGGVALSLRIDGTERLAFTDTNANRLDRLGMVGVLIDGNSTLDDVEYDSLIVEDFATEWAGAGTLATGVSLIVDGTYYSASDLAAAKVRVGRIRDSLTSDSSVEFSVPALMTTADAILYPGAVVSVLIDATAVAFGRIQPSTRSMRPGEGRVYSLVSARGLAADVLIENPETRGPSITWNLPEDHAEYVAARGSVDVGDAIKEILDEHVDGDTGLRAHLAAPPDKNTLPYVQAELDLLTSKVPGMSVTGDVLTAVEQLLSFTKYALWIDPETLVWHIMPRLGGTLQEVDVATTHVLGEYVIDPGRNCTAVRVVGERPEVTEAQFDNGVTVAGHTDTLGLTPGWDAGLEATHTAEKAVTNRADGTVDSVSGSGANVSVTPVNNDPDLDAHEWIGCSIGFVTGAEAGEVYEVEDNTASALDIVGPWRNGGPANGNTFVLSGNRAGGGRDNGHVEMGRRYVLDDVDAGIPNETCTRILLISESGIQTQTTGTVTTPDDLTKSAELYLDLPSIGLVNFPSATKPAPCNADGATTEARVELNLPTYSRVDPTVSRLWYPKTGSVEGYRGTAFSFDSAKWDGAGRPGYGDVGVMRPYDLTLPEYDGTNSAAVQAVCAEILEVLSPLARSVTVTVPGLILTIRPTDRLQIAGGPSELETVTDLDVLAVEWSPGPVPTTTYYAGSQAAGEYDIQAMRREMVARNITRRNRRDLSRAQDLLDCIRGNFHNAGYEKGLPPIQICGDQVHSGVTRDRRTVVEDFESVIKVLKGIGNVIEAQKGGEFVVPATNSTDPLKYVRDDGRLFYLTEDGWQDAGPDLTIGGGDDGPAAGGAPWDEPDDLGEGSIEGVLWAAIQGILANLGKTIDMATGKVIAPGTVNNGTNNPDGNPWITFSPDDGDADKDPERTPVAGGDPAPPTTEPPKIPLLGNLLKTEADSDGTILDPGTTIPSGGGKFRMPPDWTTPPTLPAAGTAPGSALSLLLSDFRIKGLSLSDAGPVGVVFSTPDGSLWVAKHAAYATGPVLKQVEAVAAGTGVNGGDYGYPGTSSECAPAVHVEADGARGVSHVAETPADGEGVYLQNAVTSSVATEEMHLPSGAHGYDSGAAKVQVTLTGDTAGDGAGNFRVHLYATWRPAGGAQETEVSLGADQTVANPGNAGQTVVVEKSVPKPTDATPGSGTTLSIRVERVGGDAADTATDRMAVLAVAVDAPVQSPTMTSEGYTL